MLAMNLPLILIGVSLVSIAALSKQSWFWVWFRNAFNARGDDKRETLQGRLYYYWADAKMSRPSYLLGVVGGVAGVLGSVLS